MIARSPQLVAHHHPSSHSSRYQRHCPRNPRRPQQLPQRAYGSSTRSSLRSAHSVGTLPTSALSMPSAMSTTPGQSPSASNGLTPYLIYLLAICTIGPLLFGYHLAELNAPQDVITCKNEMNQLGSMLERASTWMYSSHKDQATPKETTQAIDDKLPQCIPMNPTQFGAVSSLFTLGGLVGALAAGPLSSHHGRLRTMLYTSIFFSIGPVLEALAPNIATMTIGRFVSGIGAGAAMVTVPM